MTPAQFALAFIAALLGALLIGGLSCVCARFLRRGSRLHSSEIDRG